MNQKGVPAMRKDPFARTVVALLRPRGDRGGWRLASAPWCAGRRWSPTQIQTAGLIATASAPPSGLTGDRHPWRQAMACDRKEARNG